MTHQEFSFLRRGRRILAGLFVAVAGTLSAQATTITSTNFNTWKTSSLSGAPTELNFYPISQSSYNNAVGITLTGGAASFKFTGLDNGAYFLAGDSYNKTLSGSADNGAYINVGFQTAENAFLVVFSNAAAANYVITLSDGQVFNTTANMLGFSLSHTVTGLTVATSSGTQAVINDFYWGTSNLAQDGAPGAPAPTPEPVTVLLLLAGGLFLFSGQRRFSKVPAAAAN